MERWCKHTDSMSRMTRGKTWPSATLATLLTSLKSNSGLHVERPATDCLTREIVLPASTE